MHFTGTIWRPPYEAGSLLLQVAAGCTHHSCKFCTLYHDLPFSFRLSPMEEIEADLREAQMGLCDPIAQLSLRLQGIPRPAQLRRVFLTGANPFALSYDKLEAIAGLIRQYLPSCQTIGCFARVTDIAAKTGEQLRRLARLGFDGLSIGAETGDPQALDFMDKGYGAQDVADQARRLDQAKIGYHFTYLAGISGAGRGREGALASAEIFNQTNPGILVCSMLTVFPESRLYQEIQQGRWQEAGEIEKLQEIKTLIAALNIPVHFATLGASNAIFVEGDLPQDRAAMLAQLDQASRPENEAPLREYRQNLKHL